MAGYYSQSLSNNAKQAYENGEKPLSRWQKIDIIDKVKELMPTIDAKFKISNLERIPVKHLKVLCLKRSSWHHTSSCYNKTDFYSINAEVLGRLTDCKLSELYVCLKTKNCNEFSRKVDEIVMGVKKVNSLEQVGSLLTNDNIIVEGRDIKRGQMYYIKDIDQKNGKPGIVIRGLDSSQYCSIIFMSQNLAEVSPIHPQVKCRDNLSVAFCDTVLRVPIKRIGQYCGTVTDEEMKNINKALSICMGIEPEEPQPPTTQKLLEPNGDPYLEEAARRANDIIQLGNKINEINKIVNIIRETPGVHLISQEISDILMPNDIQLVHSYICDIIEQRKIGVMEQLNEILGIGDRSKVAQIENKKEVVLLENEVSEVQVSTKRRAERPKKNTSTVSSSPEKAKVLSRKNGTSKSTGKIRKGYMVSLEKAESQFRKDYIDNILTVEELAEKYNASIYAVYKFASKCGVKRLKRKS